MIKDLHTSKSVDEVALEAVASLGEHLPREEENGGVEFDNSSWKKTTRWWKPAARRRDNVENFKLEI